MSGPRPPAGATMAVMDGTAEPAGVWVRVSTGGQDESNQVPDVMAHCRDRRYRVVPADDGNPVRYTVHGKSASKGEHQADLDRMLADMRAGIIRVLVIWHSDRIERRPGKALLDLLAEVTLAGGRVESVQEPMLGGVDFGSQVVTFIAGLINAEKSLHIAEQIGIAQDAAGRNGGIWGHGSGWGFDVTGEKYSKKLVPADEGRRYAPGIFQRVAAGESLRAVADWLEAETGRTWWAKSLGSIIRNPAWRGVVCAREHDSEGKFTGYGKVIHRCEVTVPADVWRRANDALTAARTKAVGPGDTASTALLTGLIKCVRCDDSPMYRVDTANRRKDGSKTSRFYYRCSGRGSNRSAPRGSGRKGAGCGNMLRLGEVDTLVDEVISGLRWPVTERTLVAGHNHDAEIEAVLYEMKSLRAEDLDDDEYDRQLAALRAERDRLRGLPAVPDRWEEVPVTDPETGEPLTYGARWAQAAVLERRELLRTANFVVYAGKPAMVGLPGTRPEEILGSADWHTRGDVTIYLAQDGDDDRRFPDPEDDADPRGVV